MSLRKVMIGDDVKVWFQDHVEGDDVYDALDFVVLGTVKAITKSSIIIKSWYFEEPFEAPKHPGNEHQYAIVKKAIKRLKIAKWG